MTPHQRRTVQPTTPLAHLFVLVPSEEIGRRITSGIPLHERLPMDALPTVGDVARWLSTHAVSTLKRGEPWSRQDVATVGRQVTLDQLGNVEYAEDRRYVEDMGVD